MQKKIIRKDYIGKPAENIVDISRLNFSYESSTVLTDISFSVNKQDFFGIVGPNGSGKTTLLKILLGIYRQISGSAKLFGIDVSEFKDWNKIGYVAQNASKIGQFFPADVLEVVGMGLLARKGFPKLLMKKDKGRIIDSLRLVGMEGYWKQNITQLSGGQMQRVMIARALITNPELLILDEPTTGVESKSQHEFYELLGKLNSEKGLTIILISHDIGMITKYVTRLAILNNKMVFLGTHDEFCKSEAAIKFLTDDKHLLSMHHLTGE